MTAVEPGTRLDRMLLSWSVEQFYFHEATLLDERRLREWLALWDPEARYWAPTRVNREGSPDVTVPGELGVFEDNHLTLALRVASMQAKSAWAEIPPSRTRRLISNVQVSESDDGTVSAGSNFIVYRSRLESVEHWFVGRRSDRLERVEPTGRTDDGAGWRIRERMVLLDHASFRTDNISVLF